MYGTEYMYIHICINMYMYILYMYMYFCCVACTCVLSLRLRLRSCVLPDTARGTGLHTLSSYKLDLGAPYFPMYVYMFSIFSDVCIYVYICIYVYVVHNMLPFTLYPLPFMFIALTFTLNSCDWGPVCVHNMLVQEL